MENREIDQLVAEKVMDFELSYTVGYPEPHTLAYKNQEGKTFRGFNPSSNIQDAWLVVEKLCSGRTDMSLFLEHHYATYWVKFHGDENEWEAEHTSAPMAIALAALKAVGVEVTP